MTAAANIGIPFLNLPMNRAGIARRVLASAELGQIGRFFAANSRSFRGAEVWAILPAHGGFAPGQAKDRGMDAARIMTFVEKGMRP